MVRWIGLGLLGVLAAVALAACGGGGDSAGDATTIDAAPAANDQVVVHLDEQNGSGESGTATLTAMGDGKTRVVVEIPDPAFPSQPAHIHNGTCANLDPTPLYGLVNVQDGRSESVVDAPLSKLTAGRLALNVHESNDMLDHYTACGNLPGGAGAGTTGMNGGGSSGY